MAFLQSNPRRGLSYYRPQLEFFKSYLNDEGMIIRACPLLYSNAEGSLPQNCTFMTWLCKNIIDVTKLISDPSLLFSPSITTTMLLCTDATGNVTTEDDLSAEAMITTRFKCRDLNFLRTDIKRVDIIRKNV